MFVVANEDAKIHTIDGGIAVKYLYLALTVLGADC